MGGEIKRRMVTPRCLNRANRGMELPFTEVGKTTVGEERHQKFTSEHATSAIFTEHSSKEVEETAQGQGRSLG